MPETVPQTQCVEAGCEKNVQRCSQPQVDCDSYATSDFVLAAGITTKVPYARLIETVAHTYRVPMLSTHEADERFEERVSEEFGTDVQDIVLSVDGQYYITIYSEEWTEEKALTALRRLRSS